MSVPGPNLRSSREQQKSHSPESRAGWLPTNNLPCRVCGTGHPEQRVPAPADPDAEGDYYSGQVELHQALFENPGAEAQRPKS